MQIEHSGEISALSLLKSQTGKPRSQSCVKHASKQPRMLELSWFSCTSVLFFVKADRIHLWATTQTHTCTLQKWTSCRVTVVSKFWSPVNEEAKAKQMAQKKASSSRCLGFPFGMWNIAQRTGYLASVRTLDPMLQGSDHHIKGYQRCIRGGHSAFCTRQASSPQGQG